MPSKTTSGWYVIDTDCWQYCRNKGDRKYEFIQLVWLDTVQGDSGYPDKRYAVVTDEIDLKNFFLHELEQAVAEYYDDLAGMEQQYQLPIGQLDQLIAECYFESNCLTDSCSIGGVFTEEEAKREILLRITEME